MNSKTLADAVGLPDEEDKVRIQHFLKRYEKEHPGEIQFHRDTARARLKDPELGIVDDQSARRYLFELPVEIGNWLGQAYPLMMKDRNHLRWFCRNFPELLIPERF